MPKIAVFGGTGYLGSLIKNQNNVKKNNFIFFSRKNKNKNKNYINFYSRNNLNKIKNFNFVIHLIGPTKEKLSKNKNLIKKKNKITSIICDFCIKNNIRLIYISSLQIYKYYGYDNLSLNSKINNKNLYSMSHYYSEKIIRKKFFNHKNMFTILRMGNVFGFKKYVKLKEVHNNLIHRLCYDAYKKRKIEIKDGSIQRTFIPSQIFIHVLNFIITNEIFKNSTINISFKNFRLLDIAKIIKKRSKHVLNLTINLIVKKFYFEKKFKIYNNLLKFSSKNKKIEFELDQVLKNVKKIQSKS